MFSFTRKNRTIHVNPSPRDLLLREIDYTIESVKLKLVEKLDMIKEDTKKQITTSTFAKASKKAAAPMAFNVQALRTFEKNLTKEIDNLMFELVNQGKRFEPAVINTLEIPANIGFNYGANVYNQKHNMIIACPSNSNMHFYDATGFTAIKQRKKKELSSSVVQMSYWPETDTHLVGCAYGDIYNYNASSGNLTKILKEGDSFVLAITHINTNTFAFSSSKSGKLYFGSLDQNKAVGHYSKDCDAWYLHHVPSKNVLLSGLANGKIAMYNTKESPAYPMLDSIQAHKVGKYVTVIISVTVKGKEYIITGGNDHTIKIWHLLKGKLRLLRVIQNNEDVSTIVYLENYQMIASTHHREYVKFFSLPFGKLEATVNLGLNKARNIFLMKDKNLLGVADLTRNVIKIVQLHPQENGALGR